MINGTDLAKDIIKMSREYNECIQKLNDKIAELKDEISILDMRSSRQVEKIINYEERLETVRNIISKHMEHVDYTATDRITILEYYDGDDFNKICKLLEIPLSINEVKDNE